MTTIYHPKTKELYGTIKEIDNPHFPGTDGNFEVKLFNGCEDWLDSFEEAKWWIQWELQYEYSGKAAADRAADAAYAQQERFACGNF